MPNFDETVGYCPQCDFYREIDRIRHCECGDIYCKICAAPTDDPDVTICPACAKREIEKAHREFGLAPLRYLNVAGAFCTVLVLTFSLFPPIPKPGSPYPPMVRMR